MQLRHEIPYVLDRACGSPTSLTPLLSAGFRRSRVRCCNINFMALYINRLAKRNLVRRMYLILSLAHKIVRATETALSGRGITALMCHMAYNYRSLHNSNRQMFEQTHTPYIVLVSAHMYLVSAIHLVCRIEVEDAAQQM